MFKKTFAAVLVLYFICLATGIVLFFAGLITKDDFWFFLGVGGAIASIFSLFSLIRPPITSHDFDSVSSEYLTRLAEQSEQLEKLKNDEINTKEHFVKTKQEIEALNFQRKEMEILVQKACHTMFLKEKYYHLKNQINDEINSNTKLKGDLETLLETENKLSILSEEIEKDKNLDKICKIVEDISCSKQYSISINMFGIAIPIQAIIGELTKNLLRR